MRVQLQEQALRLRVEETELARLLAGEIISNATRWPDGQITHQQLVLAAEHGWQRDDAGWRVTLAADAVRELASRLPSRDGLDVELPVPGGSRLNVRFDVDVRDSARRRYAKGPSD